MTRDWYIRDHRNEVVKLQKEHNIRSIITNLEVIKTGEPHFPYLLKIKETQPDGLQPSYEVALLVAPEEWDSLDKQMNRILRPTTEDEILAVLKEIRGFIKDNADY